MNTGLELAIACAARVVLRSNGRVGAVLVGGGDGKLALFFDRELPTRSGLASAATTWVVIARAGSNREARVSVRTSSGEVRTVSVTEAIPGVLMQFDREHEDLPNGWELPWA